MVVHVASRPVARKSKIHVNEDPAQFTKMVDMRIPLWGVLSVMGAVGLLLTNMYFSVESMKSTMTDVQATLKSGNAQSAVNMVELATIKLRLDNAERAVAAVQVQAPLVRR